MSVILILLFFAAFLTIDYFRSRERVKQPLVALPGKPVSVTESPAHSAGILVPKNLRYHPGHGWMLRERHNLARVGVDGVAASVLGPVEHIELPVPGHWVRQGQRVLSFFRNGQKVEMSSPVEGEVVELNEAVLKNPGQMHNDPYGEGWLMTVHVPDEDSVQRNLMPKNVVAAWIQEAIDRLYARQPQLAGAVMAEGGEPVRDITAALPAASWKELADEILQNG